jgi:hypothetical protein
MIGCDRSQFWAVMAVSHVSPCTYRYEGCDYENRDQSSVKFLNLNVIDFSWRVVLLISSKFVLSNYVYDYFICCATCTNCVRCFGGGAQNPLKGTLQFALSESKLVFRVVTPCGLVGRYQRFGGTYCLHLQDGRFLEHRVEADHRLWPVMAQRFFV